MARGAALSAAAAMLRPTASQIAASSRCSVCRRDWGKTGPACPHCEAGGTLRAYLATLVGQYHERSMGIFLDDEAVAALVAGGLSADARKSHKDSGAESAAKDGSKSVPTALCRVLSTLARSVGRGERIDFGGVLLGGDKGRGRGGGSAAVTPLLPLSDADLSNEGASDSAGRRSTVTVDLGAWIPELLEALQAEARALLSLWEAQAGLLSAIDELGASLTRMQFLPPGAPPPTPAEAVYLLQPPELPGRVAELEGKLAVARTEFGGKLRPYYAYLLSLQRDEGADHATTATTATSWGRSLGSTVDSASSTTCAHTAGAHGAADDAASGSGPSSLCSICLAPFSDDVFMVRRCGHYFCRAHLRELAPTAYITNARCPICREKFRPSEQTEPGREGVVFLRLGDSSKAIPAAETAGADTDEGAVITRGAENESAELAQGVVVEANGMAAAPPAPYRPGTVAYVFNDRDSEPVGSPPPPGSDELVVGSFGTKVTALVLSLLALRRQYERQKQAHEAVMATASPVEEHIALQGEPHAALEPPQPRALVFSQWDAALSIVETALRANGLSCLRMGGGRGGASAAVARFSAGGIDALLLPFKTGAEGLNITAAQVNCAASHLFSPPTLPSSFKTHTHTHTHTHARTPPAARVLPRTPP